VPPRSEKQLLDSPLAGTRPVVRTLGVVDAARFCQTALPGDPFVDVTALERAASDVPVAIIECAVEDRGCGIGREDAALLFQAFHQVRAACRRGMKACGPRCCSRRFIRCVPLADVA
jgi:hypothetical protein